MSQKSPARESLPDQPRQVPYVDEQQDYYRAAVRFARSGAGIDSDRTPWTDVVALGRVHDADENLIDAAAALRDEQPPAVSQIRGPFTFICLYVNAAAALRISYRPWVSFRCALPQPTQSLPIFACGRIGSRALKRGSRHLVRSRASGSVSRSPRRGHHCHLRSSSPRTCLSR